MVIVKQLSKFTCVAACLQSFFADNYMGVTQSTLVYNFPDLFFTELDGEYPPRFGSIPLENLPTLGERLKKDGLGFSCDEFMGKLSDVLSKNETIFITTRKKPDGSKHNFNHCVRFKEVISEDDVMIMNPSKNIGCEEYEFDSWSMSEMNEMECVSYRLSLL